jgi:hypothetical protein
MNPFTLFALTNGDAELAAFGARGANTPVHLRADCCVRGAAAEWIVISANSACGTYYGEAFTKALRLVQAVQRANDHEDADIERLCDDWCHLSNKQRASWDEIAELTPIPEPQDGSWGEQLKYCVVDLIALEQEPLVARITVVEIP